MNTKKIMLALLAAFSWGNNVSLANHRLFIGLACEKPEKIKCMSDALRRNIEPRLETHKAAFFRERDPHLTMVFIGDADTKKLDLIERLFLITVNEFRSKKEDFSMQLQPTIDLFGRNKEVAVVRGEVSSLIHTFYKKMTQILDENNIAYDKKHDFNPHVTLGRIYPENRTTTLNYNKIVNDVKIKKCLKDVAKRYLKNKELFIKEIVLFDSTRDGYKPLLRFRCFL